MKVDEKLFIHGNECKQNKVKLDILEKIAFWARKYPELYEVGDARNVIANHLAILFNELDAYRSVWES